MTHRRILTLSLLAAWVAAVAYLTLTPAGRTPPLTLETFLCIGCGMRDGADVILNWALFVPGGVLLALVMSRGRVMLAAIAFTVIIEMFQIGVAGRHPALQDLIFNSLGAVTGVALVHRGLGRAAQAALAAAVAVAWLSPIGLLVPMASSFDLYGQWTPLFGGVAQYEGRIQDVRIDGFSVPSWRTPNRAALETAIVERHPIEILLEVGPPPSSTAPVFQIADSERLVILTLGALGSDLLVRGHNPARVLGLDQPDARWPDALASIEPGTTVPIVIDRSRGSLCISVADDTRCELAPTAGDGWGFLLYLEGAPRWLRALMTLLWTAGLGLVLGGVSQTPNRAAFLAGALALSAYLGAHLSPDVTPSEVQAALLILTSLTGAILRPQLIEAWRTVCSSAPEGALQA
jgi:hypothetical protein